MDKIQKLMILFNEFSYFTRDQRISVYQRLFPKRYVCENQHEPEILREEAPCPQCGANMFRIKPKSTKHLFNDEISDLLDGFENNPEAMDKMLSTVLEMAL